jgi:hypothetical protein
LKWRSSLYTAKLFLLFPSEFTEGQNQFKSMVSFGWVKPLYEATNRRISRKDLPALKIGAIDFDKELIYYGILGNILPRTG